MANKDYSGVGEQVFEVIVRQAAAGAPWREICAAPMQQHGIKPEDVEAEVERRKAAGYSPKPFSPIPILIVIAFIVILVCAVSSLHH